MTGDEILDAIFRLMERHWVATAARPTVIRLHPLTARALSDGLSMRILGRVAHGGQQLLGAQLVEDPALPENAVELEYELPFPSERRTYVNELEARWPGSCYSLGRRDNSVAAKEDRMPNKGSETDRGGASRTGHDTSKDTQVSRDARAAEKPDNGQGAGKGAGERPSGGSKGPSSPNK